MIDLFGLGKQQDPPEPEQPGSAPEEDGADEAPEAPRGSQRLWAFLLVLDSVFVIVFAGAVAAKVYQYWKAPAAPAVASKRRAAPPKEQPKPAEPAPAPAPAPPAEPAPEPKAAEPAAASKAKPEPPAAPEAAPPKPSLLAEAPKHRQTPKPADAAPAGKVKASRVDFKISAPKAKSVQLVGAFIMRGGRRDMERQDDGAWSTVLYLNPGQYRYYFNVDKKKRLDPENPRSEKGASVIDVR